MIVAGASPAGLRRIHHQAREHHRCRAD